MAVGDVYQFVAKGTVLNQLNVNVWHYKAFTSGDVDLSALLTAFETDVLGPCVALMNINANFAQLEIKQIVGGYAYAVDLFAQPLPGLRTGDVCPPAVCFTFRYQRVQLGRRHGYKRLAGVSESDQTAGLLASGLPTLISNVEDALSADLIPISGISLRPVILHRMLNGQEVTPPEPQEIEGVHYSHIGTQNTRKFGRGR